MQGRVHPLDAFPTRDVVGRVYAFHDHHAGTEVLGAVVACWPDRGPRWLVRLHEGASPGQLLSFFLHERPESHLGRWCATREVPMGRAARYAALVTARRAYDSETAVGLANPAHVAAGAYDSDEVGPWTRWAGDLHADLMVVGQDWGDETYFLRHRGLDEAINPTSDALRELLASVGRPIPPVPTADAPPVPGANRTGRVFLTNALLWLKRGGMNAPVQPEWFAGGSALLLLEQIAIVQPRVVVALGQQAYRAILRAYDLPVPTGPFRAVVDASAGVPLPGLPTTTLVGVYHCGARVQNTVRSLDRQREDWARIGRLLDV